MDRNEWTKEVLRKCSAGDCVRCPLCMDDDCLEHMAGRALKRIEELENEARRRVLIMEDK